MEIQFRGKTIRPQYDVRYGEYTCGHGCEWHRRWMTSCALTEDTAAQSDLTCYPALESTDPTPDTEG